MVPHPKVKSRIITKVDGKSCLMDAAVGLVFAFRSGMKSWDAQGYKDQVTVAGICTFIPGEPLQPQSGQDPPCAWDSSENFFLFQRKRACHWAEEIPAKYLLLDVTRLFALSVFQYESCHVYESRQEEVQPLWSGWKVGITDIESNWWPSSSPPLSGAVLYKLDNNVPQRRKNKQRKMSHKVALDLSHQHHLQHHWGDENITNNTYRTLTFFNMWPTKHWSRLWMKYYMIAIGGWRKQKAIGGSDLLCTRPVQGATPWLSSSCRQTAFKDTKLGVETSCESVPGGRGSSGQSKCWVKAEGAAQKSDSHIKC